MDVRIILGFLMKTVSKASKSDFYFLLQPDNNLLQCFLVVPSLLESVNRESQTIIGKKLQTSESQSLNDVAM